MVRYWKVLADHAYRCLHRHCIFHLRSSALALKLGMKREHMLQQKVEKKGRISRQFCRNQVPVDVEIPVRRSGFFLMYGDCENPRIWETARNPTFHPGNFSWLSSQKLCAVRKRLSRKSIKNLSVVCGRCSREFVYSNLRELTVHTLITTIPITRKMAVTGNCFVLLPRS